MNRRAILFMLAILLLAAASTWLSRQSRRDVQQAADVDATPDYFIRAFTVTEMGPDGRPLHRLQADELTHFRGSGTTVLQQPRMTFFRPDQSPWELRAATGRMVEKDDVVDLTGGVTLKRSAPEPMELATASLRIFPKRHYAETDDPLMLTADEGTVRAVGMEAFLADERLVLRSQVRGHYAP